MRDRSLQVKLFWTSLIGTAAVLCVLLGSIAHIAFDSSIKDSNALVNSIVSANAKEIESKFAVGWTVVESVANTVLALKQQEINRAAADAVTRRLLENNVELMGLGHYWEPNGFDGKDRDFVRAENHDGTGRYITYWNRASGAVRSEVLAGYEIESAETQYYYHPLRTHLPWASEPYAYKTGNGQTLMLVSLMIPLLQGQTALGVAGADIPLETINRQLSKVDRRQICESS